MSNSFAIPWIVACQSPLSIRFPREEYWPFPSPYWFLLSWSQEYHGKESAGKKWVLYWLSFYKLATYIYGLVKLSQSVCSGLWKCNQLPATWKCGGENFENVIETKCYAIHTLTQPLVNWPANEPVPSIPLHVTLTDSLATPRTHR